jgi:hypothetical protein
MVRRQSIVVYFQQGLLANTVLIDVSSRFVLLLPALFRYSRFMDVECSMPRGCRELCRWMVGKTKSICCCKDLGTLYVSQASCVSPVPPPPVHRYGTQLSRGVRLR